MDICGPLELVTAPTGLAVELDEAKEQVRISFDYDDTHIQGQILAATQICETEIEGHRQFLLATYDLPVRCWWERLKLPRPPLSSVTWIKYYDTAGTQQTLSTSLYEVKTPWRAQGYITRAPNQVWPAYQADREYPITIRFVAGYGTANDIPPTIKQAMLLTIRALYDPGAMDWDAAMKPVKSLLLQEGYGSYG